jgi:serine/threonine-protein kinase
MTQEATQKPSGKIPVTPPGTQDATNGGTTSDPAVQSIDLSGQVLGNDFRLLRRLGAGGMGQVYLGEQLSLKRQVAVKLLRADLANNDVSRKRFKTEAEAVAKLAHANIVQVYHISEQDSHHFMVLEYVEGWNLRDYLDRKGPPDLPIALAIMRQVASALARASEVGIIHRDIKPENILLTRKAEVKVADFGLSRIVTDGQPTQQSLTQSGTTMGTPLYMSPEQVQGQALDCRTDIYSFGVTCYHMLAGQPPFMADNSFAVAVQHVQNEPLPLHDLRPDLPPDLCAMVHTMMAKKPDDRYQNAREILKELKRLSEQSSSSLAAATGNGTSPAGLAAMLRRTDAERRKLWITVGSFLGIAVVGSAVGAFLKNQDNTRQTDASLVAAESKKEPPPRSRLEEREADLIKRIKESEQPEDNKDQAAAAKVLWDGVCDRIDLAHFYLYDLKQRDLDRADKVFAAMRKSKVKDYKDLGNIGEAVVLAFRDKSEESVKLFADHGVAKQLTALRVQLGPLGASHFAKVLKMVRDALNHDHSNYQQQSKTFPKELQFLENFEPGNRAGGGFPRIKDGTSPRSDSKPQ